MVQWIRAKTNLIMTMTLALFSLILYVRTAAPTVLTADGGEFQFVPYMAGIAHPTGYPLYTMLGWLWSHVLPLGDVAYRMNLFSVLWAAAAVTLLYITSILFLRLVSPGIPQGTLYVSALVATATLAVSQTFWSQAIIAEVYSLHAFFVVLVFYLLLRWQAATGANWRPSRICNPAGAEDRGEEKAAGKTRQSAACLLLVAFTYGLSLTHHRTMLLLAPAVAVFLWLAGVETRPTATGGRMIHDGKFALKALLVLLLPLLLYLYIPWRAPFTPYVRLPLSADKELVLYQNTPQGFFNLVMGQMFRGELGYRTETLPRLRMAADLLRGQFGLVGMALGLLGVLRLAFGRRWALLALTGLTYLANLLFTLVYFIGDIFVLFIPSYLVFALWLALGAATLGEGIGEGIVRWKGTAMRYGSWEERYQKLISGIRSLGSLAAVIPLCILPLALLARNYSQTDQSHNYEVRDLWQEILAEGLPWRAILVSNDRDEIMPLWYYQFVEGRRPDLNGLFPRIVPEPTYENIVRLVDDILTTGRPIYLIKEMPGLEIKYQLEPFGSLVQVVGPAVNKAPDYSQRVILSEEVLLIGYDQEPFSPRPGEELRVALYWQTQGKLERVYSSFVHLVDEKGQRVAGSDQQPGGAFYPTDLWRTGEILRDEHAFTVPPETPPGKYRLLVGMYSYPSLKSLGESVFIGRLEIRD
ncbi:MAG: DUF2723 domain-containing protein [Anaerolineales bacterium]|nr:MAG: DUF2723 domain-containing protein [Anaerolineales bacterium]